MEMDKLNKKIAIIGVGHMGKSLVQGLLNAGFKKEDIILSNKSEDNKSAVLKADWAILTVKPAIIGKVVQGIKDSIDDKLLISAVAGASIAIIQKYAGNKKQKIIRIMPNIAVSYKQGVIGLFANKNVSAAEKKEVISLSSELGLVVELNKEEDLDVITLISGCSPAIIAHFMEMFLDYGEGFGLSAIV